MIDQNASREPGENRLLQLLPRHELAHVRGRAQFVALKQRQILHHWRSPMEHVYFPTSGLVSVAAKVAENQYVEGWLVGNEGMVGALLALSGEGQAPPHRRVVQANGAAFRLTVAEFLRLLDQLPGLRKVVHRYLAVLLVQTSQAAACNAAHPLKQRLARWLLMACKSVGDDGIPLTHEVLSDLLSVRRASVTDCLGELENDGAINTVRGRIRIIAPDKLKKTSCTCFELIHREYTRQLATACASASNPKLDRSFSSIEEATD